MRLFLTSTIILVILSFIVEGKKEKEDEKMNKTEGCSSYVLHDQYLLKYHAILQYTAFFLLVPLAIASAHYLREFSPSLTPWGLRIWFHLHRTLNIIAVLLTIVGIILTFVVHKWTWIGPKIGCSEKPTASMCHAIFGILAVSMLWLQPIGAVFRCAPSRAARKWFYYAHKIMGTCAWIMAAVTILIATAKFKPYFTSQPTAFILSIIVAILCGLAFFMGEFEQFNAGSGLWNNMSTSKSQSVKYSQAHLVKQNSSGAMASSAKQRWQIKILSTKYRPWFFIVFAISLIVIWAVFITLVGADQKD